MIGGGGGGRWLGRGLPVGCCSGLGHAGEPQVVLKGLWGVGPVYDPYMDLESLRPIWDLGTFTSAQPSYAQTYTPGCARLRTMPQTHVHGTCVHTCLDTGTADRFEAEWPHCD